VRANEIIDYTTARFEEVVHDVDVVFDTVGGDTLQRSWQVIKPGGVLVSIVSPTPPTAEAKGGRGGGGDDVRFVYFIVGPNPDELIQIGALIDAGHLRPIIDTVFPLAQARQAYEQAAKGHTRGKIVLSVMDS
jgi:NADPH:quinone reductase-like Zn-dependent oxidoreductase